MVQDNTDQKEDGDNEKDINEKPIKRGRTYGNPIVTIDSW